MKRPRPIWCPLNEMGYPIVSWTTAFNPGEKVNMYGHPWVKYVPVKKPARKKKR